MITCEENFFMLKNPALLKSGKPEMYVADDLSSLRLQKT